MYASNGGGLRPQWTPDTLLPSQIYLSKSEKISDWFVGLEKTPSIGWFQSLHNWFFRGKEVFKRPGRGMALPEHSRMEHSEEGKGYSRDCRTGASGPRMDLGNLEELFWIIE